MCVMKPQTQATIQILYWFFWELHGVISFMKLGNGIKVIIFLIKMFPKESILPSQRGRINPPQYLVLILTMLLVTCCILLHVFTWMLRIKNLSIALALIWFDYALCIEGDDNYI